MTRTTSSRFTAASAIPRSQVSSLGGCSGKFSYYLTGVYTHSNLGLSSATRGPDPIHDGTNQGQGFAYLTYSISPTTQLSLITGMTVASNQFPNVPGETPEFKLSGVNPADFPSTDIDSTLDQQDYYGVLALNGALGPNADYQLAYTMHYNRENFNPDDDKRSHLPGHRPESIRQRFFKLRARQSHLSMERSHASAADFISASTESKRTILRRSFR